MDNIEESLKSIFYKIKKYYLSDISGYYNSNIYVDKYYGIVIDMEKEDIEFIDYYDDQIDMKTNITHTDFLYKFEDNYYFCFLNNKKINIYLYKNNIYLKLKEELDKKQMLEILEHSSICYNKTVDLIINFGELIS